ncbi:MAG: hypothetical protein V1839_02915 [archaeon]
MLEAKLGAIKHCGKNQKFQRIGGIEHKILRAACSKCETTIDKRADGKVTYVKGKDDRNYHCGTCGSEIMVAEVLHSIFPSTGVCENEAVPYCPRCEAKPDSRGRTVYVGENPQRKFLPKGAQPILYGLR